MHRRSFVKTLPAIAALAGAKTAAAQDAPPAPAPAPAPELKLRPEQRVLFAQTVGYPA